MGFEEPGDRIALRGRLVLFFHPFVEVFVREEFAVIVDDDDAFFVFAFVADDGAVDDVAFGGS